MGTKEIVRMEKITEKVSICDVCGKEVSDSLARASTCAGCGRVVCCKPLENCGKHIDGAAYACEDCFPRMKEIADEIVKLSEERYQIQGRITRLSRELYKNAKW